MLIVVAFCFAKTMAPAGAAAVVTGDDIDDWEKRWGEPDVDDNHDCLEISILEDALTYRWSSLGVFCRKLCSIARTNTACS